MGNLSTVKWIYNTILFGLLAGLVVTYKLWIPNPPIPAHSPWLDTPDFLDWILVLVLVGSLIVQIFYKQWFLFPILSMLTMMGLCILDLNRFQPWIYFYFLSMLILSSYSIRYYRFKNWDPIIKAFRWILIILLLWGGINKLNQNYFSYVSDFALSGVSYKLGLEGNSLGWIAWPVPFIQIFGALALIFRKMRLWALLFLIVNQAFAVLLINIVNNWNLAVAPWNLAVIALLLICFKKPYSAKELLWFKHNLFLKVILFSVGTLPLFQVLFELPNSLPFSLYSGKASYAFVYIESSPKIQLNLPEAAVIDLGNYTMVDLARWSDYEYHLPLYSSQANFNRVEQYFKKEYPDRTVFVKVTNYD